MKTIVDFESCLLDVRILKLLIRRAVERGDSFYGLSVNNVARKLNGQPMKGGGYKPIEPDWRQEVSSMMNVLDHQGLVYYIKRSRARYFPSNRIVLEYAIWEEKKTHRDLELRAIEERMGPTLPAPFPATVAVH